MCLTSGRNYEGPYKFCCCFSIKCAVILIAINEMLALIFASMFAQYFSLACSVAILIMFVMSCVHIKYRWMLFLVYSGSAIAFIISQLIYFITQNATEVIGNFCLELTKNSSSLTRS